MPQMCRQAVWEAFQRAGDHPGLLFCRGFPDWESDNSTARGQDLAEFIQRIASRPVPGIYRPAYERWRALVADTTRFACWCGQVEGRLFLGLGGAHVLETNLTLSRTYGVPLIPGSSLKGLGRAYASACRMDQVTYEVLFGKVGEAPDQNDAGYLIFHDAWWIPDSAPTPFTREVVTVHHPQYYSTQGSEAATDFDSPNPNVQLAARGSFLFAVEGVEYWAKLGLDLLKTALQQQGIGGKTAAGYGYFMTDERRQSELDRLIQVAAREQLPLEQRLRQEVESWTENLLAELLGRDFNKTRSRYGNDFPLLLAIVTEVHRELIQTWRGQPKESNKRKAYKRLFGTDGASG